MKITHTNNSHMSQSLSNDLKIDSHVAMGDKMPILEFQKSKIVLRWSRAFKIRLFLKFFIWMKFDPHQAQKTILLKFDQ